MLHSSAKASPAWRPNISANNDHTAVYNDHLVAVIEILSQLRFFSSMEKILQDYNTKGVAGVIPRPIMRELLSSMRIFSDKTTQNPMQLASLAKEAISATLTEAQTPEQMTMHEFCSAIKHKLETIGVMFTLTAQACLYRLTQEEQQQNEFAQRMLFYSRKCLDLVKAILPKPTLGLIWLVFNELQVTTLIEGDLASNVWNRVGVLVGFAKTLGLHHETTGLPFFLQECHRIAYVSVYRVDKVLATLIGTAPHLLKQDCTTRMPLDITDEELFESNERSQAFLSEDGWNSQHRFDRSTLLRMRYITSISQERVLLQSLYGSDRMTLNDILLQHRNAWEKIPARLKDDSKWTTLSPATVFSLRKSHLIHSHIELQIHKLMGTDPNAVLPLCVSMLDTVLKTTEYRTGASSISIDLPAVFLHSIAPVTILAEALRQNPSSIPGGFRIIHPLSAFVHELRINCGPGRLNNAYCLKTLDWLMNVLDEVLGKVIIPPMLTALPSTHAPIRPAEFGTDLDLLDVPMDLFQDPVLVMDQSWERFWEV